MAVIAELAFCWSKFNPTNVPELLMHKKVQCSMFLLPCIIIVFILFAEIL